MAGSSRNHGTERYPCTDRYPPKPYVPSAATSIADDPENVLHVHFLDGHRLDIPHGRCEVGLWYRERVAEALQADGVEVSDVRLIFAGGDLKDDQRHSGLQKGSTVHCMLSSGLHGGASEPPHRKPPPHALYIRRLAGEPLTITVAELREQGLSTTVVGLKRIIHEKTGQPPEQQRLIFAGKQLDDDRSLSSYNLEFNATLHLVPLLRQQEDGENAQP